MPLPARIPILITCLVAASVSGSSAAAQVFAEEPSVSEELSQALEILRDNTQSEVVTVGDPGMPGTIVGSPIVIKPPADCGAGGGSQQSILTRNDRPLFETQPCLPASGDPDKESIFERPRFQ